MQFHDKLDLIFKELGFTHVQVARIAGMDASLISRFRTGKRVPSENNIQILNLAKGFAVLAAREEKTKRLYHICNISEQTSKQELPEAIAAWLCSKDSGLKKPRHHHGDGKSADMLYSAKSHINAFGEKLDALMNTFNVSNIRLARSLNVDASLISRLRTGMRAPASDSWLLTKICAYFSTRASVTQQEDRLSDLLSQYTEGHLPNDIDAIHEILFQWLSKREEPDDRLVMDRFLENLDAFQPIRQLPPHLIQSIATLEAPQKPIDIYYGIEGLQNAVIHLLRQTAIRNDCNTLLLYSNQPIEWLSDNPEFTQIWTALMAAILQKKKHIKIIHNIDRSLSEMLDAIAKWQPLYMTGLIEPYYCEKPSGHRFYQTKFIVPGLMSIDASIVKGTEHQGEYILYSDPARVKYQEEQFAALMEISSPLMRIQPLTVAKDYAGALDLISRQKGDLKILTPSLSVPTMPPGLLERILTRAGISEEEKSGILAYQESAKKLYANTIAQGNITEMVAFPEDEDIFTGKVEVNLPRLLLSEPLTYTVEEFTEHIKHVIAMLEQNQRYHLCPLPISPFQNIRIILKENDAAMVIKGDQPATAFLFEHPLMCRAFNSYIDALNWKAPIYLYERNRVIQQLLKFTD